MHIGTWLARVPARATLAIGLALTLYGGGVAAAAAGGIDSQPSVASTLDVCADEASGQWRYSGVVAVAGAVSDAHSGAARGVAVEHRIQNQTSRAGFADALRGRASSQARAGGALVLPYAFEAAPLSLGVLRGAATVKLAGQSSDPNARILVVESETVTADSVCGCAPKGCVRTQGYWGNKPNVAWPAPYSRTATFFSSSLSWQQILDTPPRGSGYLILAHQYIAAVLNRAAGASAPAGVQSTIDAATAWFAGGTTPSSRGPGACAQQIAWAGILDTYNNGLYPGAPKHCD